MDFITKRRENEESKNNNKNTIVIKLKYSIKREKKKISSLKALDLLLWHHINLLTLLQGLSHCPCPFSRLACWVVW
jgi:hypothetical protein